MHARSKLLAAARELFLEQGLDVSLDSIANKAGTTRQTLYNHFSSKTQLLIEAFDSFKVDLDAPFLNDAMQTKELAELLLQLGQAIQQHFYDPRVLQLQRLLILALVQMPEVLPELQQRSTSHTRTLLAAALAQAHARKSIHVEHPEDAAKAFLGAAMGPMYPSALLGSKLPSAQELECLNQEVCRTFMRAWQLNA